MRKISVAIIGGGPAGLTAGLYAARAGLETVMFEAGFPGGQASTTDALHNYPGFPGGIGGPELMANFAQQAEEAGMQTEYAGVSALDLSAEPKIITTEMGEKFEAEAIILCMGAKARKLDVPGEEMNIGRGVSYCATCDGALYRDKDVVIVGGGNTAVEDGLYLARSCRSVTLIHRRDELRASGHDVERLKALSNVQFMLRETISAIERRDGRLLLQLGSGANLLTDGLFVAVGTVPQTDLVKDQIELDEQGYILSGEDTLTSLPGVFAAGDIRRKPLRQVVTAASDGAVAATAAAGYISSRN